MASRPSAVAWNRAHPEKLRDASRKYRERHPERFEAAWRASRALSRATAIRTCCSCSEQAIHEQVEQDWKQCARDAWQCGGCQLQGAPAPLSSKDPAYKLHYNRLWRMGLVGTKASGRAKS